MPDARVMWPPFRRGNGLDKSAATMRILSGIQPSGALHIGNYFGALKQFIDLQSDNDAYYFVADYHALTSVRDAAQLRGFTFDVIVTMLALGLDPERATLFVQSDVPETTELGLALINGDANGLAG